MLPTSTCRILPVATFGVMVLSAGCATAPNAALEQARQAYAQAQREELITTNAPVALYEAGQALRQAEQAESEADVSHLAYVARQRVKIARAEAQRRSAEADAQRLLKDRDNLVLQSRDKEIAALKARKTPRGYVMTLGDVLFEYNKAALRPGAQRDLYQLVTFLRDHAERTVSIEGHTDSHGSESYNFDLSERRARSVGSFLMENGISGDRIATRGFGEGRPVASNATETGRQANRRVEIVISDQDRS